ncbi:MAG: hypothetical protein A3J62_01160 [Candidatus Buchananbacteria bacterium RIFCSPHIGHO2_02_FULL_38_8]|uniref:Uncharacterized protein n=2 Tax=Candidatus Buchananiibacteriota TaxID=1817903 RepID=A0A1G1XX44_9BACT|nr:MAG: hypothetical protein A2731_03110 [Candidatus Buchananbacteria bacterium RIFCSPHIGHO2_01_FULL_39_8]OGY47551.1 MAG: hypothetical protein A3J62_01160 [Candidatus Buchananbacteria bacterium RIFCSPHIGHO2_02_FULL_38_8]
MIRKIKITLLLLLTIGFIIVPSSTSAETCPKVQWLETATGGSIKNGLIIPCECLVGGQVKEGTKEITCNLNSLLQTIINFTQLILAVTGSAALLMFTYGGVMFIISSGNQERITKGKEILKAAAIGIVLIFTSWLIINFTIYALTGGKVGLNQVQNLFGTGRPWNVNPQVNP